MIYGHTKCAMEYSERGAIDVWLQLFLRNDGGNIALADGLLREDRFYFGPVLADISEFEIEEGAPSYLTEANDIQWFFHKVDKIKEVYGDWDIPPLIVNYSGGKYEINDGRHRHEALRQMKIKHTPVVFWSSTEEDYRYIMNHYASNNDDVNVK
ncbi:ParB N-terminal domain-containing protein [Paenibacillus gorillae]|uniref:ParB N-terminal domain-containing protein n=1 Tax=Paenibacillus gorillae TaxID=1243662 RepID=UPI0005A94EF8|nr:ParB N-terminal domain-containing protein [Paenibacillus gorillae]